MDPFLEICGTDAEMLLSSAPHPHDPGALPRAGYRSLIDRSFSSFDRLSVSRTADGDSVRRQETTHTDTHAHNKHADLLAGIIRESHHGNASIGDCGCNSNAVLFRFYGKHCCG